MSTIFRTVVRSCLLAALVFSTQRSALAADILIDAPCSKTGGGTKSLYLRSCDKYLTQDVAPTTSGSNLIPGLPSFKTMLATRFGKYARVLYKDGVSINVMATEDENSPEGSRVATPICSIFSNVFNGCKNEDAQNHLNQSCGRFTGIDTQMNWWATSVKKIKISFPDGEKSWEFTHQRGAYIQALSYYYSQVMNV